MSEVKFSLPEFCERYEYNRRSPDQPIQEPAGNGAQRKNNYVFSLDDRTAIYDWSKAYFEVGFRVELAVPDGGGRCYTVADEVSMINGVHSLIRRLTLQGPNGAILYDTPEVNKALFLKKLLEFGPDFAETSASNELWYYDNSPSTSNNGAINRRKLIAGAARVSVPPTVKARIPFNSYSFFDSLDFNNVLLSNMSLKIVVDFETDNNLIFKDAGLGAGRVVITKFDLWLPQLTLHASSAEKYIRSLDTPLRWSYMRERVERSPVYTTQREGRYRISGVNKPKKAFFYFFTAGRDENQDANMYRYDSMFANTGSFKTGSSLVSGIVTNDGADGGDVIGTVEELTVTDIDIAVADIGIGENRILERCRLEFDDGSFYPHVEYGSDDIQRYYHDVLEYSHRNDNVCCGSLLSRENYKLLNSLVYFDLDYQKRSVVSDAKDMTFVWSLDGSTTEPFLIYAVLLYENDASFDRIDNQFVLLSEVSK